MGNDLGTTIPSANVSPMDFMPKRLSHSVFLYPITSQEIVAETNNLDSAKATGRFSIPIDTLELIKYNFKTSGNNFE